LLKLIEEAGMQVEITGFRNVRIANAEDFLRDIRKEKNFDVESQFFDAEYVATWEHLYFAALGASLAFKFGTNISKNLGMETLLYASAQRQITKAIEFIGVKPDSNNVAVIVISEKPTTIKAATMAFSKRVRSEPNDSVLEFSIQKRESIQRAFGITEKEIGTVIKNGKTEQAIVDLIIERMALLPTQL
jgi:tRNA threonylcarbamoyladenosine modification (KEOPS) complex Cgi121 subunit